MGGFNRCNRIVADLPLARVLSGLLTGIFFISSSAGDFTGNQSYLGKVVSVSPGFYNHVGVVLEQGATCNGQSAVLLLSSNPKYKEIYALLLLAQSTGQIVHLARIQSSSINFGGLQFCVITEASLGANPYW